MKGSKKRQRENQKALDKMRKEQAKKEGLK